jgi:hypothetical protein
MSTAKHTAHFVPDSVEQTTTTTAAGDADARLACRVLYCPLQVLEVVAGRVACALCALSSIVVQLLCLGLSGARHRAAVLGVVAERRLASRRAGDSVQQAALQAAA